MSARAEQDVVIPYRPHVYQRRLMAEAKRYNLLVCHRRFGKTVHEIAGRLLQGVLTCRKPRPRFAYIAPLYSQAKQVAWDYLKFYSRPIPGIRVFEAELRIDYPNGGRIKLYGADNPDSLRGIYLDGCVLDEYGDMKQSLLTEVVYPALADRQGWLDIIGTPKGRNHFHTLKQRVEKSDEWCVRVFPVSLTGIVPEKELARQREMQSEDVYAQEWECSFEAAVRGAYWATELARAKEDGRITPFGIDPTLPVDTYWDLGMADSTAIWMCQNHRGEPRVVGCYENHSEGLEHYVNVLHDWRDKRGVTFGRHWAPHDIEVRELTNGRSRRETARAMGINFHLVPNIPVQDGIEAARLFIRRAWIHEAHCDAGLRAVELYRRDYDEKHDQFRKQPLHDWTSHYADAFRYMAVAWRERPQQQQRPVTVVKSRNLFR